MSPQALEARGDSGCSPRAVPNRSTYIRNGSSVIVMGTGCALRRECEAIRAVLISAMAAIEAQIDFFDLEDSEALTLDSVKRAARTARDRIDRALASAKAAGAAGRVKESFVVVIEGPPNVGKSTLMNALAGRDFAITSPFAGTTRDPIEVFLDLRVYPVILVDTAGIREADDPIEREGVNRALRRAADVDLTLWLDDRDGRRPPIAEGPVLVFHTKIDRPGSRRSISARSLFAISAKFGEGGRQAA